MQHFLKIGGKRYGEVRNFKKARKFASSNLKFRSSKFKFTEILICNPGGFGNRHEATPGGLGTDRVREVVPRGGGYHRTAKNDSMVRTNSRCGGHENRVDGASKRNAPRSHIHAA